MQSNPTQTNSTQADPTHVDPMQTNVTQQTDARPDYLVALNNWLQCTTEGNLTRDLSWTMKQTGPNNQAVHYATAKLRGVNIGEGKGISKNLAKSAAAEKALDHLKTNELPPAQQHQD